MKVKEGAFKLSLAFSGSRFVVPWVALMIHQGSGLAAIDILHLTFLYSGTDVLQVKWTGDCK